MKKKEKYLHVKLDSETMEKWKEFRRGRNFQGTLVKQALLYFINWSEANETNDSNSPIKYINLAKNNGIAIVDADDFEHLSKFKWCLSGGGYAMRGALINNKWTTRYMHHEILGETKGRQIDHIDRNKLNNRKCNLRFVTRSQNQQNYIRKDNTSGVIGVYKHKASNKWAAQTYKKGKIVFLGYFDDKADAAKAYDSAVLKHFGPHALTNLKLSDTKKECE